MVLSVIVSCLGLIQFSLGIVAADNDSVSNRKGVIGFEGMPPEYDIYAEKNNPWKYYCTGENNRFNWVYHIHTLQIDYIKYTKLCIVRLETNS